MVYRIDKGRLLKPTLRSHTLLTGIKATQMPPLPCGSCVLPSELVVQLKMERSTRSPLTRPLPQVRFSNNHWHVDTNLKDFNVFPYCFKSFFF